MPPKLSNLRLLALFASFTLCAQTDVTTGNPDAAPVGFEEWISPIVLPAPPVIGTGNWGSAIAKATELVAGLTLEEKVNITTGMDMLEPCLGITGARFNFYLSIWMTPIRIRSAGDFAH